MSHNDDDSADCSSAIFGQVGTGKTRQISTDLIHRLIDGEDGEFIDPKGESESGGKPP